MKALVDGNSIHYELSGRQGAPVVVLSHALASSMVMWQPQLHALQDTFRVLCYDMRGHGASESTVGPYNLEMLAADVVGLLDALKIEKAHFVGLSIGGMIGQTFALQYQDRLVSLTLCDTNSQTPTQAKTVLQQRMAAARASGMAGQVAETMQRWFSPEFLASGLAEVVMIREQIAATPLAGYVGCLEAISNLACRDRLAEITVPTLIMVGQDDSVAPVAASEIIHERIAGSQLVVLPSSRHLSNIEQDEPFNAALLKFLSLHSES